MEADRRQYAAGIGAPGYDRLRFSAPPRALRLSHPASPMTVVRHMGINCDRLASSRGDQRDHHTVVVNLSSGGRYWGWSSDARIDKPLRKNDISFVPKGFETDLVHPAKHSVLLLYLPELGRGETWSASALRFDPIHCEPDDALLQTIRLIAHEVTAPGPAADALLDGLALTLALRLARHHSRVAPGESTVPGLGPAVVERVRGYIDDRLEAGVSLTDMAGVAGLSPYHFARAYKRATGESPYQTVGRLRLDRARGLLASSSASLVEIALACGFSSQAHFTNSFTRGVGIAPGRYRASASRPSRAPPSSAR